MANVLILDDSNDILEMLKLVLSKKGHHSTVVPATKDFYFQLRNNQPDIILLNVNLRGADGREICLALKKDNETKHIPVMLMSANPALLLLSHRKYRADGVLEKPFDINELIGIIDQLLL